MEAAAAPGNCLRELPARDQIRQESGTGRPEESASSGGDKDAEVDTKDISPHSGDEGQAEARTADDESHEDNNAFAIEIIGDVAGRESKEYHRPHLCEPDQAEVQSGASAFVKFPADGHGEHLLTKGGDEKANEIEDKIPISQNGIRIMRQHQGRRCD